MVYIKQINVESLKESNRLLRALWALLRADFGTISWQYTPRKCGKENLIRLGWLTLGKDSQDQVEVTVQYGKVGVIRAIQFTRHPLGPEMSEEVGKRLLRSVEEAIGMQAHASRRMHAIQIISDPRLPLDYYRAANWYCGPLTNGNSEIGLAIEAFDEADMQYEFQVKLSNIVDILSISTNFAFEASRETGGEVVSEGPEMNTYWDDEGWIEGAPIVNGTLRLTSSAVNFCDAIVAGTIEDRILRSANLFHKAITLNHKLPRCDDVATALLVSALEALPPKAKPATCQHCGQPTYKIAQKVVDLAVSHLGPGVERVFKDQYSKRSQYLHAGIVRSGQPRPGRLTPQLDPNAPEGCAMPWSSVEPHNLLEFTSYVLRREMFGPVERVNTL